MLVVMKNDATEAQLQAVIQEIESLGYRVQKDGTIIYPLAFPVSDIEAEDYRKCAGKRIHKSRFSFTPECTD